MAMEQSTSNISHLEGDIWNVPCIANFPGNFFQPLYQPSLIRKTFPKTKGWSKIEDTVLKRLILERGDHEWGTITKEFNAVIGKDEKNKTARECRERWINHLDPTLKKGQWTREEDISILKLQLDKGNKWSYIAEQLQGRTDHSVKNRWISLKKTAFKQRPDCPNAIEEFLKEMLIVQKALQNND